MCPECKSIATPPTEEADTTKRIEYHTVLVRRRIQQRLDENGTLAEQWVEKGITCPNSECGSFISLGREGSSCIAVSRHGLEDKGITCPNCNYLATEPGDWRGVHLTEKVQRDKKGVEEDRWDEEGVCCWNCNSYLMASPDSDIDPLKIGEEYDRDIYHRFARPEGWTPPIQRTEERAIVVDDWVVVNRGVSVEIKGKTQDIGGAEGRVKTIQDGIAEIMTVTLPSLGKTHLIHCNVEYCKPMLFDTLKTGTPIRVRRGRHEGKKGTVKEFNLGRITVQLEDGTTINLPIERVVREI